MYKNYLRRNICPISILQHVNTRMNEGISNVKFKMILKIQRKLRDNFYSLLFFRECRIFINKRNLLNGSHMWKF